MNAVVYKEKCREMTYTYYTYYGCVTIESGTRPVLIETILTAPPASSSEYTSTVKGVNRSPGFFSKYDYKQRCATAVSSDVIVTIDEEAPFVMPIDSYNQFGSICKYQSGSFSLSKNF